MIYKKKSILSIMVILTLCVAIILSSCSEENQDNNYNWSNFTDDLETHGFLPHTIVDSFTDFTIETSSEGSPFYYWRSYDDSGEVLHKIELEEKDGILTRYHYKSYNFDVPYLNTPMSKDEALDMVRRFAEEFVQSTYELDFKNGEGASSLYDPEHVEGWIANSKDGQHVIMVDLDMGSIVYYSSPEE